MIDITVEHIDEVLIDLRQFPDNVISAINFDRIGIFANDQIHERTSEGKDANNNDFAPYSFLYKEAKTQAAGRHGFQGVDLNVSGRMLGAISSKSNDNSATVYFLDGEQSEKAYKHNEGIGGLPKREFFALSNDDTDAIKNMMIANINSIL